MLMIFLFLGIVIRLSVAFLPGFRVDINDFASWALRLNEVGFAQFYNKDIFTDYTPGYLYILGFIGWLKNIFNLDNITFYYLLKLPAIFCEIFIGIILYHEIKKSVSKKIATLAAALVFLNPALIFNSSIWGQMDSIPTLLMLLSVIFLKNKKLIKSSILISLALLVKPQSAAILPIFVFFLIKNFSFPNFLKLFLPLFLIIYLPSVPFFPQETLANLLQLLINSTNVYPYNSLFAYNLWGLMGFWVNDNQILGPFSLTVWGIVLLAVYLMAMAYFYFRKGASLFSIAALSSLAFYFLLTRIHERYLYPAIPFLILTAAFLKSRLFLVLTVILNLIYFINLYYVYVYYNELYFQLPKLLYYQPIYDLLDKQGRVLSIFSTIIFVFISGIIIKLSHGYKKT